MLPIHTILHPTDFSEQSDYAFGLACALARDHGARLILLHVASLPVAVFGEAGVFVEPEDYQEPLKRQLDQLRVPDASVPVERRIEEGEAAAGILRVAGETNAGLIVMGTHGRTGLGRLLAGSVAARVMRKAPCPVLTVKTPFAEAVPSRAAPQEQPAHAG
jgi:nucleotide-binding universal stress UspA family protein